MSKVTVFTRFSCVEGKNHEVEEALRALVAASEEIEDTEVYSYHRGEGDDYWFFAVMSSAEAMETHAQNDAMKAAMPALMPLMAGPPEMFITKPIAAKGLPL